MMVEVLKWADAASAEFGHGKNRGITQNITRNNAETSWALCLTWLSTLMEYMPLDKSDLRKIKEAVVEAVDPYIEKLMLADHKKRIEKLEFEVKELRELFAIK